MASDRKSITAEGSDLGNVVGAWLDPFAQDASAAASRTQTDAEPGIPFSDWCIIPVAFAIVIGDMILQFLH